MPDVIEGEGIVGAAEEEGAVAEVPRHQMTNEVWVLPNDRPVAGFVWASSEMT